MKCKKVSELKEIGASVRASLAEILNKMAAALVHDIHNGVQII